MNEKQINTLDKEIVFWGTGNVCRQCLSEHPEVMPSFFIDSFSNQRYINGRKVKHPEEIVDWTNYFVVITIVEFESIEEILEEKKLKRNINFCDYKTFFENEHVTTQESISKIRNYITSGKDKPVILVVAPIFIARNTGVLVNFFKSYFKMHQQYKFVIISELGSISPENASRKLETIVFEAPQVCKWNGIGNRILSSRLSDKTNLTQEDEKVIQEIENFKLQDDKDISYKNTREMYCYLIKIIHLLNPQKLIIWGKWARISYILEHLAIKENISYGFMEHGWLPGTIQFDSGGIAGQSIYAMHPERVNKIQITEEDLKKIEIIKKYILSKRMDTGIFFDTVEDREALNSIMGTRKTVFLVGMDERGMAIAPNSKHWKKYVSSVFSSMDDVLGKLLIICQKRGWNIIYKPHPGNCLVNLKRNIKNNAIVVKDKNIDELIEMSDVVISMSSAVEYKALMYGKPLVQVGITGLNKMGCTYSIDKKEDLENMISKAIVYGMTDEQKNNYNMFLARLLKGYLWDDLSERKLRYGLNFKTDFLYSK